MSVYTHFRHEERPFIERALEWLEQVEQEYRVRCTDFLDPRQRYILRSLSAKFPNVCCSSFGGFDGAERCRVVLHQDYLGPGPDDFALAAFEVRSSSSGFAKLKHKDFLGSLLGTGLKRDKSGDILLQPDRVQLIVAKEIADYLRLHFNQVHRIPVFIESLSFAELIPIFQEWKEVTLTVPSTRVDAVAGDVFRLSRSKVLTPIRAGHLKVNWMVVDSPSFQLKEGDVVSLRGFGRFQVLKDEGLTRKGNTRLEIGILQ